MNPQAFIAEINRIVPGLCGPGNTTITSQSLTGWSNVKIDVALKTTNASILVYPKWITSGTTPTNQYSMHVSSHDSASEYVYCGGDVNMARTAVNHLKNLGL